MPIKRVLLAEDEEDIQKVARMSLKFQGGVDVVVASNGEECLQCAERETFDVILLDAMMPKLDGYETCRRLKANPNTRDIPVIFLTAKTQAYEVKQGLELGAIGYLTKPFEPTTLFRQIVELVENSRAAGTK